MEKLWEFCLSLKCSLFCHFGIPTFHEITDSPSLTGVGVVNVHTDEQSGSQVQNDFDILAKYWKSLPIIPMQRQTIHTHSCPISSFGLFFLSNIIDNKQ